MNIALPTLLLLLFLLPGILLSYAYRRGFFHPNRVTLGPVRDELGVGIVWALVLHPLFAAVALQFDLWNPNPSVFFAILSGSFSPVTEEKLAHIYDIFVYAASTSLGALAIGTLAHLSVRWSKFDIRYQWIRFNNEWFYLFSGEARLFEATGPNMIRAVWNWGAPNAELPWGLRWADTPDSNTFLAIWKRSRREVKSVRCSAVVTVGDNTYLYNGIVSSYHFDTNGELDSIVLQSAQRIPLHNFDKDTEASTRIPGDFLLVRYADVRTLNIAYAEEFSEEDFLDEHSGESAASPENDPSLPET